MTAREMLKRLDALAVEIGQGLEVGPESKTNYALTGEPIKTFVMGRYADQTNITDEQLIERLASEMSRYRKLSPLAKTIYWRFKPKRDEQKGALNKRDVVNFTAAFAISNHRPEDWDFRI